MKTHKNFGRFLLCALALAGALALPSAAWAVTAPGPGGSSAWTIYGFANGRVLYDVLQSASALAKNSSFRFFLMFITSVGLLGAIAAASLGGSNKRIIGTIFGVALMLNVGLSTRVNVAIEDPVLGYANVVSDVPFIVAIPEAVVSTVGYNLAQLIDTFFNTANGIPTNLTATGGGAFNLAASIVRDSTKIVILDPQLRATLAAFAANCIVPSIVSGRYTPYDIAMETSLFSDTADDILQNGAPSPLTPVYTDTHPEGAMLYCGSPTGTGYSPPAVTSTKYSGSYDSAYKYISAAIRIGAPQWAAQGLGAGTMSNTAAMNWMTNSLSSAESYLYGGTLTSMSGGSIRQMAALNALSPALNQAAIASGQSQEVVALSVAQGEVSQKTGWATAVVLFNDLAGYVYSILQAFLIALTPILIAAAFVPGTGWKMLGSYTKICIWLALWMPMLSMISFIVSVYASSQMPLALGGAGGYNMLNITAVDGATEHLVLAAGFLATLTPLLSWALVNGTFAFTEFLGEGLATKMAGLTGSIAATGNISLDNKSMDNTSLHQQMLATKTVAGNQAAQVFSMAGDAVQNLSTVGGDAIQGAGGTYSASASTAQRAALTKTATSAQSAAVSAQSRADRALSDALDHQKQVGTDAGSTAQAGGGLRAGEGDRLTQEAKHAVDSVGSWMIENGYDTAKVKNLQAGAKVNPGAALTGMMSLISSAKGKPSKGGGNFLDSSIGEGVGVKNGIHSGGKDSQSGNAVDSAGTSTASNHSAERDWALSELASVASKFYEGSNASLSRKYGEVASLSRDSAVSWQQASLAQEALEHSTSVGGAIGRVGGNGLEAGFKRDTATAAGLVNDLPASGIGVRPSELGGGVLQQFEDVSGAVKPGADKLPKSPDSAATAAGAVAAAAAANRAIREGAPQIKTAEGDISNFEARRQRVAYDELDQKRDEAARRFKENKYSAETTRQDQTKAAERGATETQGAYAQGHSQTAGSTNSANPTNLTLPAGDDGHTTRQMLAVGSAGLVPAAVNAAKGIKNAVKGGSEAAEQAPKGSAAAEGAATTEGAAASEGAAARGVARNALRMSGATALELGGAITIGGYAGGYLGGHLNDPDSWLGGTAAGRGFQYFQNEAVAPAVDATVGAVKDAVAPAVDATVGAVKDAAETAQKATTVGGNNAPLPQPRNRSISAGPTTR
ncbi:MAG: conjugal transfer protein TraG N-terminal domain-containing protein [Sinobacteraceae bacterium]|nr:conjugal transfer protein TraG N-terminal domain-containing protein [Nevskiaceae bacterium]